MAPCCVAGVIDVVQQIRQEIEEFKPYIPLIQGLRNPGMRQRHWDIVCRPSLASFYSAGVDGQLPLNLNFLAIRKLSKNFIVRKFSSKNTKFEYENPHFGQFGSKIKILSTIVSSDGNLHLIALTTVVQENV